MRSMSRASKSKKKFLPPPLPNPGYAPDNKDYYYLYHSNIASCLCKYQYPVGEFVKSATDVKYVGLLYLFTIYSIVTYLVHNPGMVQPKL